MRDFRPGFDDATSRGLSAGLWKDAPDFQQLLNNPSDGFFFFDDFMDFGLPGTQTTEINLGRYKVYNTGAGKVITDSFPNGTPATAGGYISMLCDTAGDQHARLPVLSGFHGGDVVVRGANRFDEHCHQHDSHLRGSWQQLRRDVRRGDSAG